ncbi:MAG TPA: Gfo/Idh/MocA family oxidoreductase [Actinocrinis sp.]|nr:Gfo/Idh/MocA family oxidoreductase [Actinocrinis sp.]
MAERIRWAIAGTGTIASAFADDLARLPDAQLVAVGSRSKASADAFAQRFGIPNRHQGYAELAADPEVDAVYVAVPHTGHCETALAAIAAGKAVLVEKPFTVNEAQARRLVEAAAAAGTFLMEAMWVRFLPHFVKVRELVAEGRIGALRSVAADRGAILSSDPAHRILAPALAGGALLDLGVYPVSFASMVLGEPDRVEALMRPAVTGVDAQASLLLGHAGGAHALITTVLDTETSNAASITGTDGRIDVPRVWDRTSPVRLTLFGRDGLSHTVETFEFTHEGNGLRHQAAEVGRCLRAGLTQSPVIPLDETLAVMRTLDAARERMGLQYPGEKE